MRDNEYRDLSAEESDARAAAGEPFAIRLKVAETGKTSFKDAVYGPQERDYAETEDLVLPPFRRPSALQSRGRSATTSKWRSRM